MSTPRASASPHDTDDTAVCASSLVPGPALSPQAPWAPSAAGAPRAAPAGHCSVDEASRTASERSGGVAAPPSSQPWNVPRPTWPQPHSCGTPAAVPLLASDRRAYTAPST